MKHEINTDAASAGAAASAAAYTETIEKTVVETGAAVEAVSPAAAVGRGKRASNMFFVFTVPPYRIRFAR